MRYQVVRRGGATATGVEVRHFTAEGTGTQWVTFGLPFASGEVAAGLDLLVQTTAGGAVTSQGVVQATWEDGSCCHAIVSALVTGGQSYRVVTAVPQTGDLTVAGLLAAIPGNIASVTLSGSVTGTMTARDLLESSTNRARINNSSEYLTIEQGPQMLGVVVAQNFDTHLRVSMHLRWYGGTTLWCGYLFENGYATLSGKNSRSYAAVLVLNGVTKATVGLTSPVHYGRASWYDAVCAPGRQRASLLVPDPELFGRGHADRSAPEQRDAVDAADVERRP
jgi:hypothetical protein